MNNKILVVDDNEQFLISLSNLLRGDGYQVFPAKCSKEAFDILKTTNIGAILLDVRLGDESGTDVLMRLSETDPLLPVIMLTGYASIESAVNSIKLGAFDYIQKPVKFEKLKTIISNALMMASLKNENKTLHQRLKDFTPQIISNDPIINDLKATIERLGTSKLPILLYGENGTGKEVFADYIHSQSSRRAKHLIKINCAAFADSLLENELFGHDKGAYTGASSTYKGVFEKADGGTLFLDEIGDMSLNVQSKVLRVLQNKELFRLGGNELVKVDVHFISATNKRLEDLMRKGLFREDLYYRLNAATISIPPLRERKADILLLVNHFLTEHSKENGRAVPEIGDDVIQALQQHHWPGNIRELKNVLNYAAAICMGNIITIDDLPASFTLSGKEDHRRNLFHESEKSLILKELKRLNFNKKKVAESLKISRSTLYSKMRKYEI